MAWDEGTSEQELVEQARGDPAAFGKLYDRYVNRIYSYIYHRVGNHHDAEDLTARTFYRALSHIERYVDRGAPFSAWLYRIAHNLVANWHRDRSRRHTIALDDALLVAGSLASPHERAEARERSESLRQAIRRLGPDRQQLLILKFTDGLSNAEIGQIMGRSEGAIKSLYHRTLLALQEMLREDE
ncbi:MAG: sigma-70 family RNA polymerase sigma factor [Anaerolineae bacterium]|nr:sigma-70 family RNA polymerase sigma factor [Anaerolineae bacterium]